jgi:hypothetical protein
MLELKEVMNVWQNVTFLFNKFAIWAYLLIIIDFRQIILMVGKCSFLLVLSFSYGLCRTELLTLDYDYII